MPANAPANGVQLPDQVVSNRGYVTVPYAGEIRAAGRSAPDIARDIVRHLTGKANQPQAIVRIVKNSTATVTVVGDVANSTRMPLSAQGERLLDAIASAGGVKQGVGKMTVQITRGDRVRTMPLSRVINDPRQNVMLQPRDVVTALYQPFSYTVLGATGRNEEVNFEATGLSLGQAIGRAGGLVDNRANAHGVFVFRYEDPALLPPDHAAPASVQVSVPGTTRVPVIFRIDLKDPGAYFVAQNFAVRNKDILYVSNARYDDLQRFTQLIGSVIAPAATAASVSKNF